MFLPAEYNMGSIAAITNSRFTGNSAEADFGLATGGTIQNNGTITEIKNSDFLNNYTLSNEHSARGGAIQNSTRSVIEQIINSKFDGNYAKVAPSTKYFSTNGGAIDNSGTINLIADSEFTNNYIELTTGTNLGGALHNTGQIGKISNVKFIGNTTNSQTGRGGAIYSAGKITEIVNSEFTDNRIIGQQGYGGALNLTNGITITNSKFENNSIQAEKGAGSGGAINFSSAQDIILKNSSFYNNFIKGKHITNAKGGAVYKAGTGSFIIEADGSIGNGKSVLNIDAGQMDPDTTYKVQIIKAENQEHAPQLKLNDIDAITQISADIFSNTLLAAGFGVATTDTQIDSIEIRGAQDALAEWAELSADTKSFTFAPDALKTVLTRDISGLQGKELNINGIAGSELDAAGHNLLSNINKGQKINFSDLTVSNFGNIANRGTVMLSNVDMQNGSIANSGSLQTSGNNIISGPLTNNAYLTNTGILSTQNGLDNRLTIRNNSGGIINITGSKLISNAGGSNTIGTPGLFGGIVNNGTLELTGGTFSYQSSGNGEIIISGNTNNQGTMANTVTVNNGIEFRNHNIINGSLFNNGTTYSKADGLLGEITNTGKLYLNGNLNGLVKGTGTTYVNSVLDIESNAGIVGTLNLNGGTVDLHEDTGEIVSFSSRNIGSLQGNGNLMIDVDIKNRLSDSLNITDGSQNGGTVHLSSINVRSDGTGGNNILTYLKGILSGLNFTVGDNDQGISTMTEDYVYTFTKGDAGMLNVVQTLVTGGNTLKHFIEGVLPVNVNTYSATNDIAVLDTEVTLGTTNNTDYKTLNLNMNGYKLTGYDGNGQKNDGIAVAGDYTFNLQGSSKNEANSLLSNFAKALTVAENGKLNIVDVTFSDNETDIENSGTINFTGSNKADTITGTGTMTVASGKTQINATIEQDTVNIEENAALTNKGLMTANAVINGTFINDGSTNGNITITDSGLLTNNQTLNSDNFTNTGNITNIDILNAKLFENTGTVDNNGTVTADNLINKAGGKLTSSVSALRVNNRLQNDGTLNLAGGANNSQNWAKEINGSGKLNFSGKVRNTAALSQGNITITAGAQLTNEGLLNAAIINNGTMITSANSLGGTTTSNNTSVLQLTGGTLTQNILGDGNAQILGNVILSGNGLLNLKTGINEGASLTGSAGSLGDTVTNAGILNLTGETLSIDIQGKEQTQINGNVTLANNGSISQNVTIGNNAMLTVNQLSGLISTVRNDGTLKLLEGTAVHQINGSGTIQIAGNVINNTVFDNLVKVENGAEFTNNGTISQETTNSGAFINATAAGLNGSVNNLSEGRFTNRGTIDGNIDNSGTFFNRGTISGNINNRLGGTFTSRADRFQGTVNNAGELILSGILNKNISGTGTTIVGGNTFGMNGGVKIDGIFNLNNKILNLQEQGANEDADYGER